MQTPFPNLAPAASIADVAARIEEIIAWSIRNQSRLGYFAALYKRITLAVGAGCAGGRFQDPARLERLDALFANRYFAALNGYFHPGAYPAPSQCWRVAFDAAQLGEPVIVSHMLAGVNAHIGLDLGIAAYQTAQPGPLDALQADFDTINTILTEQVKTVLGEIDDLSPVLSAFYDLFQKFEIPTIDDGLVLFRDDAWSFALLLRGEMSLMQSPTILARDLEVAHLGGLLLKPPSPLSGIVTAIARQESSDVVENIQVLDGLASSVPTSA